MLISSVHGFAFPPGLPAKGLAAALQEKSRREMMGLHHLTSCPQVGGECGLREGQGGERGMWGDRVGVWEGVLDSSV